jgi:hypothetical protein
MYAAAYAHKPVSSQENGMASEKEFIRKRLNIVMQHLQAEDSKIMYEGYGRGRKTTVADEVRQDNAYKREARLLYHVNKHVAEGQVHLALRQWRTKFGAYLAEHRERHKKMIEAYDNWWTLPYAKRARIPQPARPPQAIYTDQSGDTWVIDDKFLLMLDDLTSKLEKWLQED